MREVSRLSKAARSRLPSERSTDSHHRRASSEAMSSEYSRADPQAEREQQRDSPQRRTAGIQAEDQRRGIQAKLSEAARGIQPAVTHQRFQRVTAPRILFSAESWISRQHDDDTGDSAPVLSRGVQADTRHRGFTKAKQRSAVEDRFPQSWGQSDSSDRSSRPGQVCFSTAGVSQRHSAVSRQQPASRQHWGSGQRLHCIALEDRYSTSWGSAKLDPATTSHTASQHTGESVRQ